MLPLIPFAGAALVLSAMFLYTYRKNVSHGLHRLKNEMTVEARAPYDAQPVWYAGLVVEPAEFAQQLANLQISLQRANAPVVRPAVAETPQAVAH